MTSARTEIISKLQLVQMITEALERGKNPVIPTKGRSMHPYIREGIDNLILAKADPATLSAGDMVFALTTAGDYVMHRIIKVNPEGFTLMGDGNLYGTERCLHSGVIARLDAIDRAGRIIRCNTRSERAKAWIMRTAWRTAHKALRHLRKITNP